MNERQSTSKRIGGRPELPAVVAKIVTVTMWALIVIFCAVVLVLAIWGLLSLVQVTVLA